MTVWSKQHYYHRNWNIAMIAAFISCLTIFNMIGQTKDTAEVTLYFIPDAGLCLGNSFMTFHQLHNVKIKSILFSRMTAIIIYIGFYINIASAVFYILLALEKSTFQSNILENSSLINNYLWPRFADIMKFKVVATLHAITFKIYFDDLRKEYHSAVKMTTSCSKQE